MKWIEYYTCNVMKMIPDWCIENLIEYRIVPSRHCLSAIVKFGASQTIIKSNEFFPFNSQILNFCKEIYCVCYDITASCWPCSIFGAVSDSYIHTNQNIATSYDCCKLLKMFYALSYISSTMPTTQSQKKLQRTSRRRLPLHTLRLKRRQMNK